MEETNIFEEFVNNCEIIVNENSWKAIVNNHTQEFIIKQLSDAIVAYNIRLPYREITQREAIDDYIALKQLNTSQLVKYDAWGNKFDYNYAFINKYIDLSSVGNKSSDFFHQVERWKCDATGYPSPQKTWETEQYRLTLFKALFSLKVKEINPQVLRTIISLRKYIAAQFRPSAAKAIYDMFLPETVLDFSMGWGDRLAGAHASDSVEKYVGFDPNISLIGGYAGQIRLYNTIGKPMNFKLYPHCAEDETIELNDKFDMVFTSPPYFDKEKYDQSERQSYKKYKGFDSWMNDFLNKAIEIRTRNLKKGGYLIINISDIYTRKKHYKICDGMNTYLDNTDQFDYLGAMGLRMPKRPMSKSNNTVGTYGEPIWIWKKK